MQLPAKNSCSSRFHRPHPAWVVAFGCLLVFSGSNGLLLNCNTVFAAPVPEALGVSRGAFQLHMIIANGAGLLVLNLYGELFRRHPQRLRQFLLVASVVACASVYGYSFATKLWHFYILSALFGLCEPIIGGLTLTTILNNWFVTNKGLALGFAFTGSSVVGALILPSVNRVVTTAGWQWGYRLLAVGALVLLLAGTLLFIRESPTAGQTPLGATPEAAASLELRGLTRAQAARSSAFWFMTAGLLFFGFANQGIGPHIIAALTAMGYTSALAAWVTSAMMAVTAVAKLALGALFDRVGGVWSAALTGLCALFSALAMTFAGVSPVMLGAFALFHGFTSAMFTVSFPYLINANFGPREYAAIYSLATSLSGLGGLSSILSGSLYDATGSYQAGFVLCVVAAAAATACLTAGAVLARRNGYSEK